MRTRTFSLLTLLLVLLATSCMPDSFTKFKEDPPTKTSASGGQAGDVTDPADTVVEEEDDLVFDIEEVFLLQSEGDIYFFGVLDGTGYSVGDELYVSKTITGTGGTLAGTITHVGVNEGDQTGSSDARVIGVRLGSSIITPATDADKDDAATSKYNSDDVVSTDDNVLATGYFIDNCSSGYGGCSAGTSSVTQIESPVYLYVPSSAPPTGQKNLDKRIYIRRGDTVIPASSYEFEYTLNPDPIGIGFENTGGSPYAVRIASPEGPFLAQNETGISDIPYQLTVSLKVDGTVNKELDAEETYTYSLYMTSAVPVPVDEGDATRDFELSYYLEDGDEFAVVVDNVAGFSVGEDVRACSSIDNASCNTDNETPSILGKARIRHIETGSNTLYLTAADFDHDANAGTTDRKTMFKNGLFIHNASGEVAVQVQPTYRMFKTNDGTKTLVADFNVQNDTTDDPAAVTYSIGGLPTGMSFSASTGTITIDTTAFNGPSLNNVVTVTARNSFTGDFLDNFELDLSVFGTFQGITHEDGTSSTTMLSVIGGSEVLGIALVTDIDSSNLEGENFDFGGVRLVATSTLPNGVTLDDGTITFEPTAFFIAGTGTTGQGPYTIQAYHDAYDESSPFGSVTISFKSASEIENIYYPQSAGQRLILKVDDVSQFFTSDSTVNLSTPDNGQAIVKTIDSDNKLLYVEIDSGTNLSGPQVFKEGDKLDTTSSYVVQRGTVEEVIHVFSTSDAKFQRDSGSLAPAIYNSNGDAVTLATGEDITWSISPSLPSDMRFDNDGATPTGAIEQDASGATISLSPVDSKTYTVVAESEIGEVITGSYNFAITSTPGNVSVGRYQFVRLSGNGNRFFRGSTISTADGSKGRVLMPIDIDGDLVNDGILTEFNGDIADNAGIDNVGVFAAAEATAVPYIFIDMKDNTNFASLTAGTTLCNGSTGKATVVSTIDTTELSRVYARLNSGTIASGDILKLNCAAGTTYSVTSVEDRHYINGIIEVNAEPTTVQVGGFITGGNDARALVVQKSYRDTDSNGTVDTWYLLVQHVEDGADNKSFSEGLAFGPGTANSGFTIDSIVGPNINITIAGGSVAPISSSTKGSGASGNLPFWEGNLIVGWLQANGGQTSAGFAVAGSSYSDGKVVVNVEDYNSHFLSSSSNGYIDDFSEYTTDMDPNGGGSNPTHNVVTDVEMSNLVIGYVDEAIQIEPTVTGGFAIASLSPSILPAGMSFDTTTGRITGTPEEPANLETYTITFSSADGSTDVSYSFPMVVYNHFTITGDTENASSYVMHREGQGLGTSRCRVFGPQINDDVTDTALYNQAIYGTNDVICWMEGAEKDLEEQGIAWNIASGAGMCEYVRYVPFSYAEYAQGSTDAEYVVYEPFDAGQCNDASTEFSIAGDGAGIVTSAGLAAGNPLVGPPTRSFGATYCHAGTTCTSDTVSEPACLYDYGSVDGPNLDEGSYTTRTVRCSFTEGTDADGATDINGTPIADGDFDDPGDIPPRCDCVVSAAQTVSCNGDTNLAIQGPVRDAFPALEARSVIYSSFNGLKETQKVSSPGSLTPQRTNAYVANYIDFGDYVGGTPTNSCFSGTYNFEAYSSPGTLSIGRKNWNDYALNGSAFASTTSKFYRFECLDAGNNIKARIRVMARDWDREFTPASSDLELVRVASPMDDSTTSCFGESCNSAFDLDNIISAVGDFQINNDCGTSGTGISTVGATTIAVTLVAGSANISTAATRPAAGATVVIDPTGMNIPARVVSSGTGAGTFVVDKVMPSSTNVNVDIISTVPTFPGE